MMRKFLPPFAQTFSLLFLFHFCFLLLGRIIFYFICKPDQVSGDAGLTQAFFLGFIFDISVSSYALAVPLLLLFISDAFPSGRKLLTKLSFIFCFLVLSLSGLIFFTNIPYFKQFGNHVTRSVFLWNASPGFILGLIFGSFSYYGYLLVFVVYEIFLFRTLRFVLKKHLAESTVFTPIISTVFFVFLAALTAFGARGRLSAKSPAHAGTAIVGPDPFVNQLALNPHYAFFNSFIEPVEKYREPETIDQSFRFMKKYLNSTDTAFYSVNRKQISDSSFSPCNVVIICMESMSAYKTGIHGRETLTPFFNKIVQQSLYFDRFFSTGIHTSNGLFSVCSGFPSLPGEQPLMKYSKKPFTTLANLLSEKNYASYFLSTHDPEFDNMGGFFRLNGFKNIYSGLDLPSEKNISVTGVPDHELFEFFIDKINEQKPKNFISFIMTGSDHGPWKIPDNIPFKPSANTPSKRSTQYADWALGQFIEKAKRQSWYSNTLFVFVGDHGSYFDGTYEMALSYHHVPFVMHMPSKIKTETSHKLGAQYDILSTIAGFMNLSFTNSSFGKNLLKEKHEFVCISADDKAGCLSEDGYFFFHHFGQNFKRLMTYENLDGLDYYSAKKKAADSLELKMNYFFGAAGKILNSRYSR